jgi:hypothetical protein
MSYLKELQEKWDAEKQWGKDHPIQSFFINVFVFFRYDVPRNYEDIVRSVRYGFQRMFRGYDDFDVFEHWQANAERNIKVLKRLRETKVGAPYTNDPDGVLTTPDTPTSAEGPNSNWFNRRDEALGIMIEGFEALLAEDGIHLVDKNGRYDPVATKKESDRLFAIWEKGAKLYIANMSGLWD